ncbi:MAG: hypothetical protein EBU90_02410 [Proteobacteria bacterium]|nr:hypothetical protein [Pseudomonadota bacterium]NBP13088.1 hypothetical protein [bacterium]
MNTLTLQVVEQSKSGSYHVKLFVDEKEAGIFYLTEKQFDFFVSSFRQNARDKGITFSVENPFDFSEEDDENYFDENN